MLNILVYGVVVHFVFLASIFVIYFQSPVIQGLAPQSDLKNPPAKRLILFVADGLRAESFYRNGCNRTKFLQSIILDRGIHGYSHTRIPTESRPGHVALIAGLYEDPSAVLRGWQENPVDFDSLFNRSRVAYSWGSPDVLSIFTKADTAHHIHTDSYSSLDEDFSGKASTINLDRWVFDKFERFLTDTTQSSQVADDRTVIFLHLLGLDTAGHVHKPNSKLFDDNLLAVDKGIERVVRLVESHFRDSRTAFVFTADHGMTDAGAHGAGNAHETETPFIAWGAGINHWRNIPVNRQSNGIIVGQQIVPRFDILQADAAPLMASLIGVAVPVNNFGTLPLEYLKASSEYISQAIFSNALQMASQYKRLHTDFARGFFSQVLSDFEPLNEGIAHSVEKLIATSIANGQHDKAVSMSKDYIRKALAGIDYYHLYYQNALLVSVCVSMLGWMVFLVQRVAITTSASREEPLIASSLLYMFVGCFTLLVIGFILLQRIPLQAGILFLLPIACWIPCNALQSVNILLNKNAWFLVVATDIMVWTFFYRFILSLILIHLPVIYVLTLRGSARHIIQRNMLWTVSCVILAIFPTFPMAGQMPYPNWFLIVGLILWLMKTAYAAYQDLNWATLTNIVLLLLASSNLIFVINGFHEQRGLLQMVSWTITGVSLCLPLLQDKSVRLAAIANSFCIPYILTSLSYEPVFMLTLAVNLESWVRLECRESNEVTHQPVGRPEFRQAYVVMTYVLISFFGTGNLASISSFDPNCVRCFVDTFSPFLMAALIIMKLFIPVLFVICASASINIAKQLKPETLFIVILLMCDIMCAHFLFCVKNKGSWLDIGVSISHFVIMESTALVLCVLELVSRWLLTVRIPIGKMLPTAYKSD